ncbi:hypothetical protein BS47DRAFT_1362519 [Hydnum rufescens UP504]|uniref:Uncharacterized protein n=1 Tax=Hydnum rufescens UP504 TaxID=1448309 RepID=A0A9P6DSJ9_9AGAM|nr:hypothetical protein BS47DRAFT_1362519 [Hydnum rufescens UP504]
MKELLQPLFNEGGNDLLGWGILHIVHNPGMTLETLLRLENKSALFLAAQWGSIVPSLGLRGNYGMSQLEISTIPQAILPPSFHHELMSTKSQRIMNEKRHECIPENPMPSTPENSGGEVKHEVFLFNNLILFIIQMKFTTKDERDYYAQILLKVVSAIQLNHNRDFDPQPPVYVMLSDLKNFYFLSYNGTKF